MIKVNINQKPTNYPMGHYREILGHRFRAASL